MGAPPCQSRQRSARELWGTLRLKDFGVDWKLLFQFLGNLAQWGVWRGILLIHFFIGGNLLFDCEIVVALLVIILMVMLMLTLMAHLHKSKILAAVRSRSRPVTHWTFLPASLLK